MSLQEQLYKVIDWANRNGCPDAADFIRDRMTRQTLTDDEKAHAAAVKLGRRGGQKGGKARAEKLSDERRKEIARKAAWIRWNGEKAVGDA